MSSPKIAICIWGLPRSISGVYPSQKEFVFDLLEKHGIAYDIYVHTWRTSINQVWDWSVNIPLDYESISFYGAKKVTIDDQEEFLSTIRFEDYYYEHEKEHEWSPQLLKNHLCALESQKRCVNNCIASNNVYDYVMFLRPDALIQSPFPIHQLFLDTDSKHTIILPSNNHYEGYNDRFAVMRFEYVLMYSHRINQIKEFRRKHGRIVSEKYVKYVVDKYFEPKFVDFYFRLLRSDGSIM
jgi:hypothetical protein